LSPLFFKPGDSTGRDDNRHEKSDQWLYVGSLLLIEAGEEHEIKNSGAQPLVTINVYAPPA